MIAVRTSIMALTTVLALAACGGDEADTAAVPADAETVTAEGTMEGMPGMGTPAGMDEMGSHMERMEGATGDSLIAMLPVHRQRTANMIAQFNREMREMNMATDAAWDATVESLRDDLKRLPDMSSAELTAFMPEHRARIRRLMEMHRSMMEGMRM